MTPATLTPRSSPTPAFPARGRRLSDTSEAYRCARAPWGSIPGRLRRLVIGPKHARLGVGEALQLQAFGIWDHGAIHEMTRHVTWRCTNALVASVGHGPHAGLVTGRAPGAAMLYAFSTHPDLHPAESAVLIAVSLPFGRSSHLPRLA